MVKDNSGLFIIAIVAVVAIVFLFLISGSSQTSSEEVMVVNEEGNVVGMALMIGSSGTGAPIDKTFNNKLVDIDVLKKFNNELDTNNLYGGSGCGENTELSGTGTYDSVCIKCDDSTVAKFKPVKKCKQTTFTCAQTMEDGRVSVYTDTGAPYSCSGCISSCDTDSSGSTSSDPPEVETE